MGDKNNQKLVVRRGTAGDALQQCGRHLWQGLRLALLLPPLRASAPFAWGQLAALICLGVLLPFAVEYALIGPDGYFSPNALPGMLFFVPLLLGFVAIAAWPTATRAQTPSLVMGLFALVIPILTLEPALRALSEAAQEIRMWLPWLTWYGAVVWLAVSVALATRRLLEVSWRRLPLLLALSCTVLALPLAYVERDQTLWMAPYDAADGDADANRYNTLATEENFYQQPELLSDALDALQPGRTGKVDLYFVGMAGWAPQDVFMKEVNSVTQLFDQRFGTQGRSLRLINNAATVATVPIASSTGLQLSLQQIASVMNKDEDILFLFMTSHGSRDHKFALDFGVMRFNDIDPDSLRKILDDSGIKRRVIVISACYSGGFIDALKNDDTLVITAAAADRSSFGCSNEDDFTYFGKAYFDQALRQTYSFTQAFDIAKGIIAQREKAEGYPPSEPQMSVGKNIGPVLDTLALLRARPLVAEGTAVSVGRDRLTRDLALGGRQRWR